ncbi:Methanol dehydrogenase regulator [Labilithrix luteola]|uniref:Methanol dehydrogenase regulator n=1 Tax=Labilithrix luteola TaxID=1391654 RepID=A0A0K1Q7H8_9BACT|nr:MoxR family ATPase [Labilithrix luteola]AKV01622.1 Methanol dehydrogenase regulator [Labilithrix luteola]
MTESVDASAVRAEVDQFRASIAALKGEIAKTIVGNEAVVEGVLVCLLAGGHALLEGVPGLGKTMLVRTLSESLSLNFSRIQFTPDLMPADILGTTVIDDSQAGGKVFEFRKGPVFSNIVLADEINRATPKTQSALLEAMQEHRVSVGKRTYVLDEPFVVLATQNPLEMEGTYPLPEAQLDRFFFKLHVPFPNRDELHAILDLTTGEARGQRQAVLHREEILRMQALVRRVPVARHVQDFAIRVIQATHPDGPDAPEMVKRFVRFGASPRGAQATLLAAKIRALFEGRFAASIDDVRAVVLPALRHRVLLNFEGEAEGMKTDQVLESILKTIPETKAGKAEAQVGLS